MRVTSLILAMMVLSGLCDPVSAKVAYTIKKVDLGIAEHVLSDDKVVVDEVLMTGSEQTGDVVSDTVLMSADEIDRASVQIEDQQSPEGAQDASGPVVERVEDSLLIEDVINDSKWTFDLDLAAERFSEANAVLMTDDTNYEERFKKQQWRFQSKDFEDYYLRSLKK
jgi:hypothetical protein